MYVCVVSYPLGFPFSESSLEQYLLPFHQVVSTRLVPTDQWPLLLVPDSIIYCIYIHIYIVYYTSLHVYVHVYTYQKDQGEKEVVLIWN